MDVGNVVIVRDHALDRAPYELWVEQTWVGVVKVKRPDRTVIDGGGRWHLVPTSDTVDYAVGNTVEASAGPAQGDHPDDFQAASRDGEKIERSPIERGFWRRP